MKYGNFTKKLSLICFLCVLTFTASSCINIGDLARFKYEKTENLNSPLMPDSTLVLENDVGSIIIEGLDVSDCKVDATIKAKAPTEEEAQQLVEQTKIGLVPSGNTLTVKITKPPRKKHRSISINFNITVPRQTALQISSDVGEIQISNITGTIKTRTDVGEISCKQITGDVDIQSDVGKVNVVYSKDAPATCNANIKTDVGSIDLTTPPECSAVVQANTDVGSIRTDMPLTIKGKIGKNLNGTIGNGKGKIYLSTDVGSIRIR
jgi:hypothetical protein